MKKLLFLLFGIFLCHMSMAQCFDILGKGSDGKTPCSGKIWVYKGTTAHSYKIIIRIDDILNKTWTSMNRQIIDERSVSFRVWNETANGVEFFDIIMQKCDNNSNIYFFVLPKLYGGNGAEIYKTSKAQESYNYNGRYSLSAEDIW